MFLNSFLKWVGEWLKASAHTLEDGWLGPAIFAVLTIVLSLGIAVVWPVHPVLIGVIALILAFLLLPGAMIIAILVSMVFNRPA